MANKPLKSIKFPGLPDTYTVPEIASTLAEAGKAADAKKVGDELSDLKADLNTVYIPSENLHNPATDRHGIDIDANGVPMEAPQYKATDYIYIGASGKATIQVVTGMRRIFYYTTNDPSGFSRALWFTDLEPKTITLRPTEEYIVVTLKESSPDFMVNLGTSLLPYAPYGGEMGQFLRKTIAEVDDNLDEIEEKIEAINNIISKSVKFDVAAGSTHSSTKDKLDFNITSGESYGVFIKSNIDRNVELYEYLGTTSTSLGRVKTNQFLKMTSKSGSDAISLYVSAGDSDASFTLIAYRGDSIDDVLADNVQAIIQTNLKAYMTQFTVAAGSTHSSSKDSINIPIADGEYIYCVATGFNVRNCAVYLYSNGTGTLVGYLADGFIARFKAPIDAESIGLYIGNGTEASAITFTVFPENSALAMLTENTENDNQYLIKLMNAKRKANTGNYNKLTSPEIFAIAHFSDIHGNAWAMKQIQNFKTRFQDKLDDVICTGDLVVDKLSDGLDFWNDNSDGDVLICIGNHDSLGSNGWANPVSQQTLYETYIAPYEENWSAETVNGHSYWYKDYDDKKIRLIAVDATIYDTTEQLNQMTWFESALNGAITNGYAVVGAIHFPPMATNFQKIDSNFTALMHSTGSDMSVFAWSTYNTDILEAIDQFIDDGGDFVCWLSGHTHYDLVSYDNRFPRQLFVTISCAMPSDAMEEKIRDTGRGSGLVLNTVCVDTVRKYVKLIRYGAEWDDCLRHAGTCVIKYDANPPQVMFSN